MSRQAANYGVRSTIARLATSLWCKTKFRKEISDTLRLQLTRAEKKRLTRRHTENAEAYRLYLKGRYYWNKWTEEGFYRAIDYFQLAIEKDPGYALAYTGVADSYVLLGWNSYLPPKEAFPKGQGGGADGLATRPGSCGSPHAFGGPVVASRLELGRGSDRIHPQPGTVVPPTRRPTTGTPSS